MRTAFAAVLLYALLCTGMAAAAPKRLAFDPGECWERPQGVTVTEEEMFCDLPYTGEWQSRSFYFVGRLQDGAVFVFNLFRWHYSFIQSWGLSAIVTDGAGSVFCWESSLPAPAAAQPGFHFSFPNAVFDGGEGEYRISMDLKGFSCDLRLRNRLPAWKPGTGWTEIAPGGAAYNRYTVPSPLAGVTGTMSVFGWNREVQGLCFWDSTLTKGSLSRPNSPMYVFRSWSPSGDSPAAFIGMLVSYSDPAYGPVCMPMLQVIRDGQWAFTSRDFTLTPDLWEPSADPPYPYPGRYGIAAASGGYGLKGEFIASSRYHVTDVFQRIPPVFRGIVGLLLKRPVIYRMLGTFHGRLTCPDGTVRELLLPGQSEYVVVK